MYPLMEKFELETVHCKEYKKYHVHDSEVQYLILLPKISRLTISSGECCYPPAVHLEHCVVCIGAELFQCEVQVAGKCRSNGRVKSGLLHQLARNRDILCH